MVGVSIGSSQTVSLTGAVEDFAGLPLANVDVSLIYGGLSTTTNSQGQYTFQGTPVFDHNRVPQFFTIEPRGISFSLEAKGKIKLAMYNLDGSKISSYEKQYKKGTYSLNYSSWIKFPFAGNYFLKIEIGNVKLFKRIFWRSNFSAVKVTTEIPIPLLKKSRAVDSLLVSLAGYVIKIVPIESYTGNIDAVTLVTLEDVLNIGNGFNFNGVSQPVFRPFGKDSLVYVGSNFTAAPQIIVDGELVTLNWTAQSDDNTHTANLTLVNNSVTVTRGPVEDTTKDYRVTANATINGGAVKEDFTFQVLSKPLRVMTWNIWGSSSLAIHLYQGKERKTRTAEIIADANVDLIAMIESYNHGAFIGDTLGYNHVAIGGGDNLRIFSKFDIPSGSPDYISNSQIGSFNNIVVPVTISEHRKINFRDIWFTSGGRHIIAIRYTDSDTYTHSALTSDQDFLADDANRKAQVDAFLADENVVSDIAGADDIPLIVAGDFNGVTHLDFSQKTKTAGLQFGRVFQGTAFENLSLHYGMIQNGFIDGYRTVYPEITDSTLGYSWTPAGHNYIYKDGTFKARDIAVDGIDDYLYREPFCRILTFEQAVES